MESITNRAIPLEQIKTLNPKGCVIGFCLAFGVPAFPKGGRYCICYE